MRYFNSEIGLSSNDFEESNDDVVVKKALILVEGDHVDSQGRPHKFSANRIFQIAENTNAWFNKGNRIPWLTDHKNTQWDTIGDLDDEVIVRRVTAKDVSDKRFSHLIGKLGIFAEKLVGRGQEVVGKIKDGVISTLSPGVDIAVDIIKEISATPQPAIVGMRVFSRRANFATSWEEAEQENFDADQTYSEFMELADTYWGIVSDIFAKEDGEGDVESAQQEALQGYCDRIVGLLGMGEESPAEEMTQSAEPQKNRAQLLAQDKNMALNMAQAAYMMYREGGGDRAEFALGRKRRERKRMMRGAALGTGALGAGIGAAILARRYGRGARGLAGRGAMDVGGRLTGLGERMSFGPGGRPKLSGVRELRNKGYTVTPGAPRLTRAGRRSRNKRRTNVAPPRRSRRIPIS